MLKLKDIQTKRVIYQGLEVNVPADTNFMWLRHTPNKLVLMASPEKPVWSTEHKLYIPTGEANLVAVLEQTLLTEEDVKDSLEADENQPTAQDLEQLDVVVNLIKNLRCFANSLERNVNMAKLNSSSDSIQALLHHVYAADGELDNFIENLIVEAEAHGIGTGADHTEDDEDTETDHQAVLRVLQAILK